MKVNLKVRLEKGKGMGHGKGDVALAKLGGWKGLKDGCVVVSGREKCQEKGPGSGNSIILST